MSRRRSTRNESAKGISPKGVVARSPNQEAYLKTLLSNDITFCHGPAGTGKTHCATGVASQLLRKQHIGKIVITRPVVEVGNSIGYLPGTMEEKVGPYLTPLFDELGRFIERATLKRLLDERTVEITPLSMMRGRTFAGAMVICDEAQNANTGELVMLLTRIGEGSCMAIIGDLSQSDLPEARRGAFEHCMDRLRDIEGIGIVELVNTDIVRHHLIGIIKERLG